MDTDIAKWPNWETDDLIGRGSFGEVYRIHRNVFDEIETAALKVISIPKNANEIDELYCEGLDDESITNKYEEHLKSIIAEYTMMRKMRDCTNIVDCDDVHYEKQKNGVGWNVFIKMELLTPLLKTLGDNISEEIVIKLGKDICTALCACKKFNIIHRDIKPQNIFVSSDGDYKLGDFGIAKIAEKTMYGTYAGTRKYMAPEVYANKPYGAAADIYSLGLVLYWLLNNCRLPFLPTDAKKISFGMEDKAIKRRLSGEKIPSPINGSVALKSIVLKACEFNPEDRFLSPAQMREALETLLVYDSDEKVALDEGCEIHKDTIGIYNDSSEFKEGPKGYIKRQKEYSGADNSKMQFLEEKRNLAQKAEKLISCGGMFTVGLKSDGTVVAVGENNYGQCNVSHWKDIVDISKGAWHTVGLKSDGTVVAVGCNNHGQCNVSHWKDIIAVSADAYHTAGLKSDGTVVVASSLYRKFILRSTESRVNKWKNVVKIFTKKCETIGIKDDGTILSTSAFKAYPNSKDVIDFYNENGSNDFIGVKEDGSVVCFYDLNDKWSGFDWAESVFDWKDIVCVSFNNRLAAGLKKDGTIVAVGKNKNDCGKCEVSDWEDIVVVSVGSEHIVGLKSDGTVVATGYNEYGQCNVAEWKDIITVCAANCNTYGIKSDGTVVTAGRNEYGKCNVDNFKLFENIEDLKKYNN